MTITRKGHAHEGRTLRVIGRQKRPGMLELRVELPDGSRLHVPAAWTDMAGASPTSTGVAVSTGIGRLSHFLHLRSVVDFLGRSRELASERRVVMQLSLGFIEKEDRERDGGASAVGEAGRDGPAAGSGAARPGSSPACWSALAPHRGGG